MAKKYYYIFDEDSESETLLIANNPFPNLTKKGYSEAIAIYGVYLNSEHFENRRARFLEPWEVVKYKLKYGFVNG